MEPEIYKNFRFGNNQVQYLYQGSTLVWPPQNPHPENADIRLEYISNGNARTQPNVWFDTDFTWTTSTQVECKYSYHSAVNNTALFGAFDNGGWSFEYTFMLRGVTHNTGSSTAYQKTTFYCGKTGFNSSTYENHSGVVIGTPGVDTAHTVRTSGSYGVAALFDNGTYTMANTDNGMTGRTHGKIYLFAANDIDNNAPARFAPADTRIYAFKIYHGSPASPMLYRYFIPVLHYDITKEEYVPCFYDKVSNTYFYNKGTDPVSYSKYLYHGEQDYVLDYIERDNSGYLQYTTNCDVSTNVNFNVGFTVGSTSVQMTDLTQNVVVGSRYSANSKYGLFFPYADSSTTFAFMALGGNVYGTYDRVGHVHDNHHCDNMEFYMSPGAAGTLRNAQATFKWLEFQNGVLPDASTELKFNGQYTGFTEVDSSVVGTPIGLFSGNTVHSQVTTRLYFVDMSKYKGWITNSIGFSIHTSKGSYVPMLHHGEVCFVDIFTNEVLYNTGPGTPKYLELG